VKIDAALNDYETETDAWTVMGVTAAMKGAKQPLSIGFRNPDSLIADGVDNLSSGGLDFETHDGRERCDKVDFLRRPLTPWAICSWRSIPTISPESRTGASWRRVRSPQTLPLGF
jgi:hypothetical protein